MEYKAYIQMIRRSIDRIDNNISNYLEKERGKIALVNVGIELRQIGAIIDEAYDMRCITYNMYHLLRRWYRKYEDKVIHYIIWL